MKAPAVSKAPDWPWVVCLSGVVFLVFRAGLRNGLFGDDWGMIHWCRPHGLGFVLEAFNPTRDTWWYYRPVTKVVFGLAYWLFGIAPGPYHLLSIATHTAAAVLLFFVVRRAGAGPLQSFVSALLFAVHFRQHESVFWFSAISYPLSTSFGLASMLFFRSHMERRNRWFLVSALVTLAAAMLTKDTAVVFPALVGLYGLLFAGTPGSRPDLRKAWTSLIPLAVVLIAVIALQAMPVNGKYFGRGGSSFTPKGPAETAAFVRRVVVLSVPGLDSLHGTAQAVAASAAGLAFAGFVLIRRSRIALFGFAWVLLGHLPFYLFAPQTGDLYQYLALAGFALVIGDASSSVLPRLPLMPARPTDLARIVFAFALAAVLLWSIVRVQVMALRWRSAGEVVAGVVDAVRTARPGLRTGNVLALEGLPAQVNGAYAFLNAVPPVFQLSLDDDSLRSVPLAPGVEGFLWEDWKLFSVSREGERRLLRSFEEFRIPPEGPALETKP